MDMSRFRALADRREDTRTAGEAPLSATPMSVGQLNEHIRLLLAGSPLLSDVYVRGEISNFVAHRSGHCYFSLKDSDGLVRAVLFRSAASRLRFLPENGMTVLARGSVAVYPRDGQYQLYVQTLEPDGVGAIHTAIEQIKRRLEAEGLFSPARKRPLPKLPARIGVITSPTGAAVRDILDILGRRFPLAEVTLYPALVQGEGAPPQLAAGIRYFNENHAADVLIIGRGGGSAEDLFAFQSEEVVRAVAASAIPVISAVGHETDVTLCDFAADCRAPTPSAAAELAVPETQELLLQLEGRLARMRANLAAEVRRSRELLSLLASRPVLNDPEQLYRDKKTDLIRVTALLSDTMQTRLTGARGAFRERTAALHALSPLAVLSRGYAMALDTEGAPITSTKGIRAGEPFTLRFADGAIAARAEEIIPAKKQTGKEKKDEKTKEL